MCFLSVVCRLSVTRVCAEIEDFERHWTVKTHYAHAFADNQKVISYGCNVRLVLVVRKYVCSIETVALRAVACEHEMMTVRCHEQDVIHIINAHYGRLDTDTCNNGVGTPDTECALERTGDFVYNRLVEM